MIKDKVAIIDGAKVSAITPQLLAEIFCDLDNHEMADFFNHIAQTTAKWTAPLGMQLIAVSESHVLTDSGRRIMQELGEYSHSEIMQQVMLDVVGVPYSSMYLGRVNQ